MAFSRAGPEMSAMSTLAPSFAKRMEVSRPMPLGMSVRSGRGWRGGLPAGAGDDGVLACETAG